MTIHRFITLYNSHIDRNTMPTHIEHIEDTILTGDLSAIEALYSPQHISVKFDGVSLVWGTDPATNTFFVGTKAVFNKKKIRVAHSHDEIDDLYGGSEELNDILHTAYNYLPRTDRIIHGDFIGWGNESIFTQNTLTYEFADFVPEKMIIAPHTEYFGDDLRAMDYSVPFRDFMDVHPKIKWVQPCIDRLSAGISAPDIDKSAIKFLDERTSQCCKKIINAFIREGKPLTDELLTLIFDDAPLANLYQMVIEMKEDLMDSLIIHSCPKSYIKMPAAGYLQVKQEGFAVYSEGQTYKLVDREVFSHANFHNSPFR